MDPLQGVDHHMVLRKGTGGVMIHSLPLYDYAALFIVTLLPVSVTTTFRKGTWR
jgi:hypothetical protein